MTIASFLDSCETDLTGLVIVKRGIGRVYDGTVRSFKTDDDYAESKSELATKKIYTISFHIRLVGLGTHSHFEPEILITI